MAANVTYPHDRLRGTIVARLGPMPEPQHTVSFRSTAFNTTESKDYFINPECYGDDVARWLRDTLRAGGYTVDNEVEQEDFGWFLTFEVGGDLYDAVVAFRQDDDQWLLWLERSRGLLMSMFGFRKRGIRTSAVTALDAALRSHQEITDIRWRAD